MATFPKLENHSVDSVMLVLLTSVASVWIFPTENVLFLINLRPHGCTISCIYPPCYSPNKPSLIYIPCMELSRAYSCFEMTHTFSNLICLIFSGETIFLATDVILNNGCWQQMKNSSFFFFFSRSGIKDICCFISCGKVCPLYYCETCMRETIAASVRSLAKGLLCLL